LSGVRGGVPAPAADDSGPRAGHQLDFTAGGATLGQYRSGKKSRPRMTSNTFLAAPTSGTAFKPVSSAPLITPLRRMVDATVTIATAAPIHGSDRDTRLESRAPPQLVIRCVIVIAMVTARVIPRRPS
jgi:hypothetical protein